MGHTEDNSSEQQLFGAAIFGLFDMTIPTQNADPTPVTVIVGSVGWSFLSLGYQGTRQLLVSRRGGRINTIL